MLPTPTDSKQPFGAAAISCANCQHWKRAEPYAWGKCEFPTPWWCESRGPIIHPTENNAKDCDCYSEKGAETNLETALTRLLERYTSMVNSGDCGNWDPETEAEVILARKALKK